MCTKEQKRRIIDQIDVINRVQHLFNGLDILMTAAAECERKVDFTSDDLENLALLYKDAIMDPIFEAAEKIYQVIKEGGE